MKTSDEDSDVFEITDFTTASEWERFIARLEEILHEWKLISLSHSLPLDKGELSGEWQTREETLTFADFRFSVTEHLLTSQAQNKEESPGTTDTGRESVDAGRESADRELRDAGTESIRADNLEPDGISWVWQDVASLENDFPSRAHCLVRWFGLRRFLVLSPSADQNCISSESRANMLLSSAAIALQNTACHVPIFIQVQKQWRRLYTGHQEMPGFRTAFEMVQLKNTPAQYSHLAGLLDVFKSKLNSPVSNYPPINVSVRFTYVLQDWPVYYWPQCFPDFDSVMGGELGCSEIGELPFGACEDPVSELHLSTTWSSLSEEMVVDNDVYTDLDPMQAPHWSVRIRVTENPQCLLGDYLEEFVQLFHRRESTTQLLGNILLDNEAKPEADISLALQRLTDPGGLRTTLPSLGSVVTKATSKLAIKQDEAPIAADMLNEILMYLFPDAREESAADKKEQQQKKPIADKYLDSLRQFKSAPSTSLTWRMAICMAIVNHSYGGLRAVAHLWQEFVLEMRYRWENSLIIPDLEIGSPNLGTSLLHQKLQMLNCCIRHKLSRQEMQSRNTSTEQDNEEAGQPKVDESLASDSDDEFFDCDDQSLAARSDSEAPEGKGKLPRSSTFLDTPSTEGERVKIKKSQSSIDMSTGEKMESEEAECGVTLVAQGRLRECENGIRILTGDDFLYIPVTQEPAPMTEDALEEHAEVLAKLGTSAEGATLRARMQSACLLSDMESFKAANPGCILADFVRWYSPRDWVQEEVLNDDGTLTHKAQLSQRMQIPGNVWKEVWNSAKPVPVRRQKRLFNDTKEAEKVLHWLSSMKPAIVAQKLTPMLLHAAIVKLMEQDACCLVPVEKALTQLVTRTNKALRSHRWDVGRIKSICNSISNLEILITRAQSLRTKFTQDSKTPVVGADVDGPELQQFICSLLEQPETLVAGGPHHAIGRTIHNLFAASQKSSYLLPEEGEGSDDSQAARRQSGGSAVISDFPTPAGKEYILRVTVPRPAPWSRPTPQRMFATVVPDDFRLAGVFTQDTTFQ